MENYQKISKRIGTTEEIIKKERVFQPITENLYNYFRKLVKEEKGDDLSEYLKRYIENIIPSLKGKRIIRWEKRCELNGISKETAKEMMISATMGVLVDRIFEGNSLEKKIALSMVSERNRFLANLYGNTNRKLINGGHSNQLWEQYQ